jgi:hypothetical protein
MDMDRINIFQMIDQERKRQDKLHPLPVVGEHESQDLKVWNAVLNNSELFAVLVEEVGEVARALQGEGDLKEELIQLASVCVKWIEHIKTPAKL